MTDADLVGRSPRQVRVHNASAALQSLYFSGRMSRAELARRLGLNRSSSGQIVAELTQGGLVREVKDSPALPPARHRSGRPGILLELVPEAACFVGLEIGVEHISAVMIDLSGQSVTHRTRVFDTPAAPVEEAVARAIELGFEGMEPEMVARCQGVGVSAPMHIRADGSVGLAPLIGWRDISLVQIIEAALPHQVPVRIENDANAFAIGDAYKHGRIGVTLFLVLETGVGGGILIDGKLFPGGHGLSGEVGHMLLPGGDGRRLEQVIGREALVTRYRYSTESPEAELQNLLASVRDREPAAVSIADDWSRHLAFALVQACRLIDPNRIVLGGSVASLYPLVAARVAAYMKSEQHVNFPTPQIVVDDDAEFGSAFGAACIMHQHFLTADSKRLGRDRDADGCSADPSLTHKDPSESAP